ncbi:glycyl-tRNA synthetase beta subunit [Bacillus sp. NRRL B-14911]|uniref:Glycine--tRNA ligase beta subunit n=1 Tax=Bacillus infantis NRRL B-14911 TaxID=1367477 RepID=U5LDL1_9BACI|nr:MULTISPECIES: glycine--tRNA ligase subunit beta [Bacillus]AGX05555.1 glycine-tRNA synthetase subunit beta [Bacillus infantis NRRL B-14911]EAR63956.1 glycyl-tRNA synthetase beta subunit [Bacillus sp. NRRL B-14911]
MAKRDLLLEIGLEEMPARFVTDSINQLASKVEKWLEEKKVPHGGISAFSTPRRLAVLVKDVSETQEDIHEEAKGPARKIAQNEAGEWSKAAIGFSRGQGMDVDDIYFKEINGIEYAHVNKFIKGAETASILPELKDITESLTFPKNMRWADRDMRYVRPIKWIMALFGQDVIPFEIAGVPASNWTLGHRFLGEKVELTEPAEYEKSLLGQFVLVNAEERKSGIRSQIERLAEENNWVIPVDEDLLEEVTNLVEYPTALFGKFEEEFLEIPEEVLITSMKEHQRYFPVKSAEGKLLPYFVTVRNGDHNHLEQVAKGNEKVLRARLADAAFFYQEDQKMDIESALQKLGSIVYHEEIGTLAEKVERVRKLANELAESLSLNPEEKKTVDRAAEISKFDLVSQMVYEFPELQGFMGEKYAAQKGEDAAVAKAINEHYMPRNAEDSAPESNEGAVLAVAEKLDTISSFFAIGMIPSGSQDPYALRRQAAGIVQILAVKGWKLELEEVIKKSLALVKESGVGKKEEEQVYDELLSFFKLRIKHTLQERSIRYDIIDAVLSGKIGSMASLIKRAEVLNAHKGEDGFKESMEALSRVLNIASKAEHPAAVDQGLFENKEETELYSRFLEVSAKIGNGVEEEEYYMLLVSMRPEIGAYFENTMVMADNTALKENRLSMMAEIASLIQAFAKVNEIVVK